MVDFLDPKLELVKITYDLKTKNFVIIVVFWPKKKKYPAKSAFLNPNIIYLLS